MASLGQNNRRKSREQTSERESWEIIEKKKCGKSEPERRDNAREA